MVQLIDKSALVAEIEKIIEEPAPSHDQQCPWEDGYWCGLYRAESVIDTLEVKEVDLEKESLTWEDMLIIHKCIKDAMNKYLYAFQTVEGQQKIYEDVLKRFKAQKGE